MSAAVPRLPPENGGVMEYSDHVVAVGREIAVISDALRGGPLDVRVPTCPDWTLADLTRHLGEFTGFWTHVLCEGTGTEKTPYRDPPPGNDLAPWFAEVAPHLVTMLQATPPHTQVWTWKE
ncbi:MAG TPA: maleylpyruvate isomerase N-terminal domain-containing protein, partial [Acidimicrobiales bacterium]|nr:maleylpyruvate isomerase N-terminal domain-containing protein [Acidimicrobiales bacterium]